jgi:ABC-type phosphate/phosphonate transport system substrate-binding protein
VPTHVLAVSKRLDPAARQALKAGLLEFAAADPALCNTVFTSPLATANAEEHLHPVVEALAALPNL